MIDSHLVQLITFILSQFTLVMVVLALVICILLAPPMDRERANEFCLGVILFFCIGLTGLWGFVMHAFFPSFTSQFIGWAPSPFEFEVALANLGLGLTGVLALWRGFEFRFAVILTSTCFLWGAAAGHLYQYFTLHDNSAGNTGIILYTDIAIPAFLWLLVAFRSR